MAGTFEAFGNQVRGTMAGFANSVSGEIISSISPIIYTGIMIYFFARAYQITTGRAEGAIPDLITQCVFRTECRKFRDLCYPGGLWHRKPAVECNIPRHDRK